MQIIPLPAHTYVRARDGVTLVDTQVFWVESYPGNDLRPTVDEAVDGGGIRHRLIPEQCQLVWVDHTEAVADQLERLNRNSHWPDNG